MRFVRFETTPNPNAIKCVIQADAHESALGIRSYCNPDAARDADDPLAHDLFDIPGVANLLIHTAFITVGKSPDARWSALKPRIRSAIAGHASTYETGDAGA